MTTNVTVKTHGWPVEITTIAASAQPDKAASEVRQIVPPNSERTVCIYEGQSQLFRELREDHSVVSGVASLNARRWVKDDNPKAHTPADALREALRQLESGELEADHVIVVYGYHNKDEQGVVGYLQGGSLPELAQCGMLARAHHLIASVE